MMKRNVKKKGILDKKKGGRYSLNKRCWDSRFEKMRKWEFKKKREIGLRIDIVSFLSFFLKVYCACIESWLIKHFFARHVISYFLCHACMHHTKHQVKYFFPNLFPRDKIWKTSWKLESMPWRRFKKNSITKSERWKNNWPDWQIYLKTTSKHKRCIPEVNHPCQINRSLDHSSKPRVICHVKLIASTCGNQCPQPRLFSWQHPDLSISQAA